MTVAAKSYPGFTLQPDSDFELTIEPEGTAVRKFYYDREVFTVTWDVNGTRTEEQYRYGAEPKAPDTGRPDDDLHRLEP